MVNTWFDLNTKFPSDMEFEDLRRLGFVLDLRNTQLRLAKYYGEGNSNLKALLDAGIPADFKGAKSELFSARQDLLDPPNRTYSAQRRARLARMNRDGKKWDAEWTSVLSFGGFDLRSAMNLETADLRGVLYDDRTQFPKGFDPKRHGMIKSDDL